MSASRADFANKVLHKRMLQHILEEIGHEMIAASDVKQLGDTVNNYPELIETKAFYQSQYYYIQNVSAASFIGYVLFLEGLASTKGFDIFGRVAKVFGESSGKFVKVHAEEDQGHIESAFSLVESLPVSEYENIIQNMNQSTFMYQKMMEEISFRVAANQTFLNSASASIAI